MALANSLVAVFMVTFVLMLGGLVATLFLKEIPLRRSSKVPAQRVEPVATFE